MLLPVFRLVVPQRLRTLSRRCMLHRTHRHLCQRTSVAPAAPRRQSKGALGRQMSQMLPRHHQAQVIRYRPLSLMHPVCQAINGAVSRGRRINHARTPQTQRQSLIAWLVDLHRPEVLPMMPRIRCPQHCVMESQRRPSAYHRQHICNRPGVASSSPPQPLIQTLLPSCPRERPCQHQFRRQQLRLSSTLQQKLSIWIHCRTVLQVHAIMLCSNW